MKTYINNLQTGNNKVQIVTFISLLILSSIAIVLMANAGLIHFDKY